MIKLNILFVINSSIMSYHWKYTFKHIEFIDRYQMEEFCVSNITEPHHEQTFWFTDIFEVTVIIVLIFLLVLLQKLSNTNTWPKTYPVQTKELKISNINERNKISLQELIFFLLWDSNSLKTLVDVSLNFVDWLKFDINTVGCRLSGLRLSTRARHW